MTAAFESEWGQPEIDAAYAKITRIPAIPEWATSTARMERESYGSVEKDGQTFVRTVQLDLSERVAVMQQENNRADVVTRSQPWIDIAVDGVKLGVEDARRLANEILAAAGKLEMIQAPHLRQVGEPDV